MREHQRDTAFLRQVILYDETPEHHQLEQKITRIQRDEICVRRAIWLMTLFVGLSLAGLGYCAVFLNDVSQLGSKFIVKVFSAMGLGSFICMLAFMILSANYRKELDRQRGDCRRLAAKILQARLGKPRTRSAQGAAGTEQEFLI